MIRAIVVFGDGERQHWLAWLLKPGFRHCFVCLEDNDLWLQVDGAEGVPIIKYLTTSDFDLTMFYRDQGMTVVETYQRIKPVIWPLMLRNCVGLVKTVLCIRSMSLTPYSLYKRLKR